MPKSLMIPQLEHVRNTDKLLYEALDKMVKHINTLGVPTTSEAPATSTSTPAAAVSVPTSLAQIGDGGGRYAVNLAGKLFAESGVGRAAPFVGAGAPSNDLGLDGDTYLNSTNGRWYQKTGGAWASLNLSAVGKGSIVAGANITVTDNADGTTTIAATGGGGGGLAVLGYYLKDANHWLCVNPPFQAFPPSGATWVNQGSATETITSDTPAISSPGTATSLRMRTIAKTSNTLTAVIDVRGLSDDQVNGHNPGVGIGLYQSSSTKAIFFGMTIQGQNAAPAINRTNVWTFTNPNTFGSSLFAANRDALLTVNTIVFLRISISGSNVTYQTSPNGWFWTTVFTGDLSLFTGSPDYWHYSLQAGSNNAQTGYFISFKES